MPRHKRKRRATAATAGGAKRTDWLVGDLVVAKLRGHRPWPAQIQKPEDYGYDARPHKIFVTFFGTEETCFCSYNKITPFTIAVRKSLTEQLQKINTNPELERAIKEIFAADDELKQSGKTPHAILEKEDDLASHKSDDEGLQVERARKRARIVEQAGADVNVVDERQEKPEKTVKNMAVEQVQKLPRKVRIKVSSQTSELSNQGGSGILQGSDKVTVDASQSRKNDQLEPTNETATSPEISLKGDEGPTSLNDDSCVLHLSNSCVNLIGEDGTRKAQLCPVTEDGDNATEKMEVDEDSCPKEGVQTGEDGRVLERMAVDKEAVKIGDAVILPEKMEVDKKEAVKTGDGAIMERMEVDNKEAVKTGDGEKMEEAVPSSTDQPVKNLDDSAMKEIAMPLKTDDAGALGKVEEVEAKKTGEQAAEVGQMESKRTVSEGDDGVLKGKKVENLIPGCALNTCETELSTSMPRAVVVPVDTGDAFLKAETEVGNSTTEYVAVPSESRDYSNFLKVEADKSLPTAAPSTTVVEKSLAPPSTAMVGKSLETEVSAAAPVTTKSGDNVLPEEADKKSIIREETTQQEIAQVDEDPIRVATGDVVKALLGKIDVAAAPLTTNEGEAADADKKPLREDTQEVEKDPTRVLVSSETEVDGISLQGEVVDKPLETTTKRNSDADREETLEKAEDPPVKPSEGGLEEKTKINDLVVVKEDAKITVPVKEDAKITSDCGVLDNKTEVVAPEKTEVDNSVRKEVLQVSTGCT